jgi:hypothetical protein
VCDLENLKNEEAMTRVGSQRHREKKIGGNMKYVHSFDVDFFGEKNVGGKHEIRKQF